MNKTTLYIKITNEVAEYCLEKTIHHQTGISALFSKACLQELTTLEGRKQAIQSMFGFKYHQPLYINDQLLLFKLKGASEQYWINYYQLWEISKANHQTKLVFKNQAILIINQPFLQVRRSFEKAALIADYKNGLH